jgi:hypothetical protein
VHDRPASIDFIHWRELRDQLILYKGNYDMRTLLKDSLDGLVREAPPTGIALPIMEYYTKLAELGGDVVGLDADPDYSFAALEYDPNKPYQPCTDTTVEGARRYGLHRLHERKLSEAFAKKYPFLDVTTSSSLFLPPAPAVSTPANFLPPTYPGPRSHNKVPCHPLEGHR